MELGLAGRVAIVTGASRGIGRVVARELAAEGCHVVLCARRRAALEAVAAEIGAAATVVAADLTHADAANRVVEDAMRVAGRIDVLVNNAGANTPRKLADLSDQDWHDGFALDFFAAVRLATACVPAMRERRWGRIISVASTCARRPDPYFGPYSAAKAALVNFSANLSRAYAADGVLANCVIPGVVLTELVAEHAAAAASAANSSTEDVMTKMMAKDPVSAGRFGDPVEVSAAIVFLASERASWITGSCVTVDGGTMRVAP